MINCYSDSYLPMSHVMSCLCFAADVCKDDAFCSLLFH